VNGVLVIDKPEGMTSFDVIRRLRPALAERRIGHLGTLDPMATGVLPLCLGEATKVAQFLNEGDKEYQAEVTLGEARDSQDRTGAVTERGDAGGVTRVQVNAALTAFVGEIRQVPPMLSAVKVRGERLYRHARRGEVVEREARKVTVFALEVITFSTPRLQLRVHCSKGTYVRTIAHDLGAALGCFAHLSALRRTRAGPFRIEQAVALDRVLARDSAAGLPVIDASEALAELPELRLDARRVEQARRGRPLSTQDLSDLGAASWRPGTRIRLTGPDHNLVAVATATGTGLRYARVLAAPGLTAAGEP
jgi:tRNA pseudouridine55 synthase